MDFGSLEVGEAEQSRASLQVEREMKTLVVQEEEQELQSAALLRRFRELRVSGAQICLAL
jgi:hypothetical protein